MPELPEVQTTVNGLNATVRGSTITDVWTSYNSAYHSGKDNIKDPAYFKSFKKSVTGRKIVSAARRAKNILINLSDGSTILVHMKMTGHLMYGAFEQEKTGGKNVWVPKVKTGPLADPFNRHIRLVFTLSKGKLPAKHLALSDMRKFAKVTLIPKGHLEKSLHVAHIGMEPFDPSFTFEHFKKIIEKRPTGRIKNVLMDQTLIAGIGNIYSDEGLWHAGIHPETKVAAIPNKNLAILHKALIETLKKGIDFSGDSMSDYRNIYGEPGKFQMHHSVYQLKGKPCKKRGCKGVIQRKVVGGRSAHFCDTHQKLFK